MKLVYFSWIRERIGLTEETVNLPAEVESVADLIAWLKTRDETYEMALEHDSMVRVALDHVHADDRNAPLADVREVALFPPMTGG